MLATLLALLGTTPSPETVTSGPEKTRLLLRHFVDAAITEFIMSPQPEQMDINSNHKNTTTAERKLSRLA